MGFWDFVSNAFSEMVTVVNMDPTNGIKPNAAETDAKCHPHDEKSDGTQE